MTIEKFNKTLPIEILEAGYDNPTELQLQTLSVINSGADLFAVGPEGSGKTTAILMTVIRKLKTPFEKAPRALILVNDKEKAQEMERLFMLFTRQSHLRCECIHENQDIQDQVDDMYDGTDVVIATPKRLAMLFIKNWINLNKLQVLILDDANILLKNGHKTSIDKLAVSLPKCQHIAFTQEINEKICTQLNQLMPYAKIVEVEEQEE